MSISRDTASHSGAPEQRVSRSGAWLDLALTLALPLSTQLSKWTGLGRREVDRAREAEGPLTPTAGAFVVWAPIFASLLAYGARRMRDPWEAQDLAAQSLVRTSLLGNILWSLNSQFRNLGWQSVGLIGVSALASTGAVARYERLAITNAAMGFAATLIGPLAGWLTVATFANIDTTQRLTRSRTQEWTKPETLLPIAAAIAACGVIATRGNALYAATAGWGLGGIALKNRRSRPKVALGASVAVLAVAALATAVNSRATRSANS